MLFKEYDPQEDKMLQVMDHDGKIVTPQWKPEIADSQILEAYKMMQYVRTADKMAVSYQRQGRMYTYPPNFGQEAIGVGVGQVVRQEDWVVPAFRELAAWLMKGARMSDVFAYWGGYDEGAAFSNAHKLFPPSVPIASQFPHAVGIGYSIKYKKEDSAVFAYIGDGGTSQGDFHEALNFAAVWKVPVIFVICNNQYAISVSVKKQTVSRNLAIKAMAYGMPGIKVDGNDYFAVRRAAQEALEYANAGNGPVLIECVTFRRGAHTTSDDPSLYRTEEEEQSWVAKDPISRLNAYITGQNMWSQKEDDTLLEQYKKEIDKEFSVYENYPQYKPEDLFKYHYQDMPLDLKQQQIAYENYLNSQGEG